MVNVKSRKCRTQGYVKAPLFGMAGTKTVEYCAQHAPDEMVDIKSRKFGTQGCGKGPSFGVAGTTMTEYCAQRARLQFGVEQYRDREVGPLHFWKKSIGNAIPSGAKHTTIHPPPTKTSQPSGVIPDSHKRVRHPAVTSTMSKRAIARKPTAEAVTMAGYRRAKLSRQTKFFCEDGGAAFLVARYTLRDQKPCLLEILTYYDSGDCSLFVGFSFCLY